MLKVVIVDKDLENSQKEEFIQLLRPLLETGSWYAQKVTFEIEFAPTLESYLECDPNDVSRLEKLPVESLVNPQREIPEWIRMNTHFVGDELNTDAPNIVITNGEELLIENMPILKRKNSPHRYMFFQAADGDHMKLLKDTYYMLRGASSPVLNYLQADEKLKTLPNTKDGMCNYLPYQWKNDFPDNKSHVIVELNSNITNVGELIHDENLYFHYDEFNTQVTDNLQKLYDSLHGKRIYLYKDKFPENSYLFSNELLELLKKVSGIASGYSSISFNLASCSTENVFSSLTVPCNLCSNATEPQSQTLDMTDFRIRVNCHSPKTDNTLFTEEFKQALMAWAKSEFDLYLHANKDLIKSINILLQGNAERVGKVIDGLVTDLKASGLSTINQHEIHLKYIKQKFDYIADFTDCYSSGSESWNVSTIGEVARELNSFKYMFEYLDHTKKIEFTICVDDEGKDEKVWLPKHGLCAILNIIEASVRNTIKHESSNGKYEFMLHIRKGGECTFYWKNPTCSIESMRIIRQSLNKPLVKSDASIDNSCLGLKEIRASIRYLYDGILSFSEEEGRMRVDPEATVVEIENGWGYRFYLRTSEPNHPKGVKMKNLWHEANLLALSALMARNFSHNIGSHAILSLIREVQDEQKQNLDEEQKKCLANLIITYEYIRNKADFLSSFAFAGDGISMHSESFFNIKTVFERYTYIFNKLANGTSFKAEFLNDGTVVSEDKDLRFSLSESGVFAFFNLVEILLWNTRFSKKEENLLFLSCFQEITDVIFDMMWWKGGRLSRDYFTFYPEFMKFTPEFYNGCEFRDTVLYMKGISPHNWARLRIRTAWSEFGYIFRLQKPRELLFVVNSGEKMPQGFDFNEIDSLKTKITKNYIIPHDFLVFVDIDEKQKEDFLKDVPTNHLPLRIIDMQMPKSSDTEMELQVKAWYKYMETLFENRLCESNVETQEYNLIKIKNRTTYAGNHDMNDDKNLQYYYNEGLSSLAQKVSPLYKCLNIHHLNDANKWKTRSKIWEGMSDTEKNQWLLDKSVIFDYTTLPIIIFDERIQDYGFEHDLYGRWNRMHIYVPEKKTDEILDKDNHLGIIVENYLTKVKGILEQFGLKGDTGAVVFHESLLYSWVNKNKSSIQDYIEKFKKAHPQMNIYLMTGRGKSQYIKQDEEQFVRFLQFTPFESACQNIDKFRMYNQLMSARN